MSTVMDWAEAEPAIVIVAARERKSFFISDISGLLVGREVNKHPSERSLAHCPWLRILCDREQDHCAPHNGQVTSRKDASQAGECINSQLPPTGARARRRGLP